MDHQPSEDEIRDALAAMVEQGKVERFTVDGEVHYRLTDAGRAALANDIYERLYP